MTKNNSNLAFPNEKGNSSITLESLPKYKIKNKALMKYLFMLLILIQYKWSHPFFYFDMSIIKASMFNSLLVILGKFAYFTQWAELPTGQESITKEWGIISITENAGDPNEIWSKNKSILIPWVRPECSLWSSLAYLKDNSLMEIYFSPMNFFFLAQYLYYFFFVAVPRWSCFTTDHVTQPFIFFFFLPKF